MELLAEIFEMCSPYQEEPMMSDSTTPTQQLDRLAKFHLLQLSQVSSPWRRVALGTPRLWSSITVDTALWRTLPKSRLRALSLLAAALDRSGGHPLRVWVCLSGESTVAVMKLLTQHAQRWQEIYFRGDRGSGEYLTTAKLNLPLLQTVHFRANWTSIDAFEVAPALTKVSFSGHPEHIPKLPWSQIRDFGYIGPQYSSVPIDALSTAKYLTNGAAFRFTCNLAQTAVNTTWPHVSSDVQSLTLELESSLFIATAPILLGRILDSLTLPHLRRLRLNPRDTELPIWNPERFLAFAQRSTLHNHLTYLYLRVIITDAELLQCLAVLPRLEGLTLSERKSRPDHISITDALLQGITWKPDVGTSLIPKLRYLNLSSHLHFSDETYWDLISSRVRPGRYGENKPFMADLRCLRRGRG
ncbi:hypothetical protein B0H19DRAFT_1038676, partial [Mycena capillaripes]